MLQHLVVSHHGDPEKGALRRPMTPEAVALSVLDLLDARPAQVFSVLGQTPEDQDFSPYIPALERQLLDLRTALSEHVDAFGEKVDRIANYIKAQEAFAEAAKKEACRLEACRKSAENRVKTCKAFLCWFMSCRSLKHLKGRLNTLTLANNAVESLHLDPTAKFSPAFHSVSVTLSWAEWREVLSLLPSGSLRTRYTSAKATPRWTGHALWKLSNRDNSSPGRAQYAGSTCV